MPFNLFSNDMSESEVNDKINEITEIQVKAESNARFFFIIFWIIAVIYLFVSAFIGMRGNMNFGDWVYQLATSKTVFGLAVFASASTLFVMYSFALQFKIYCLEHYNDYATQSDLIRNEHKAVSHSKIGLAMITAAVLGYGITTLFNASFLDLCRTITCALFVVGCFVFARSSLIRSGFDKI